MHPLRTLLLAALAAAPLGCATTGALAPTAHNPKKPVRNVVFVVGDGMGLTQITAGNYAGGNRTVFERFPIVGLHKTHSADDLITDSAAGATAFATGEKTDNGAVSVDPDGAPLRTLFEEGEERGYASGLAVTSTITHATPACFYAHDDSRQHYEAIAEDLALSDVDLAIGYGLEQFNARADGRDLVQVMEERGVRVHTRLDDLKVRRKERQAVLLPGTEPPKVGERPFDFLRQASLAALDQLEAGKEPFVLVIEASQIDWGGHANDAEWVVAEQLELERTLQAVLDWVEADGQTLLVVTADHETGGLAIDEGGIGYVAGGGRAEDFAFGTSFTTGGHTAAMIPVFAAGPSAELFAGVYDNTAIHAKLRTALGWTD